MTPPLFLLDALPDGDRLVLDGAEGRHAARVRRVEVGEVVWVGDGLGDLVECRVAAVHADGLELTVLTRRRIAEPDPRIVVVQALPKGERADLALELATELGADEIVPWAASRSVTQWRDERAGNALGRWQRVLREAAKQSRRPRVPQLRAVDAAASTAEVAARIAATLGAALVLHEDATDAIAAVPLPDTGELIVVVGPEGGISPDELGAFDAAGATAVRLGEPVLRTSTAGGAALAALAVRLGRWS